MNNDSITFHPASDLQPHAKVRHLIGRWSADSDEARALRRSIQARGVLHPVIITHQGDILDGVMRWMACRALQIDVPCIERPEDEAVHILLESELHRRHHTKSQLAFRLAPIIDDAWQHQRAKMQSTQYAPHGAMPQTVPRTARTVDEYAVDLGVSVRTLKLARELHALFRQHDGKAWDWSATELEAIGRKPGEELTFREYFTAHILQEHDPMSLGGALAGLKQKLSQAMWAGQGKPHRGGRPGEESQQLELFRDAWALVGKRWTYWQRLDDAQREEATKSMALTLETAPEDVLDAMQKKIAAIIKHRRAKEDGK